MLNTRKKLLFTPSRETQLHNYIQSLPGLVAYYPLNESSGSVASNVANSTIGLYNGTLSSVTLGQAGLVGGSYGFDGSSGSVTFPGLDPSAGTFSIGFFIKTNGNQAANSRILDQQAGGPTNGWAFLISTLAIQFQIRNVGTLDANITSGSLTDGTWTLVVGTYALNSVKLFSNGTQQGVTDTSASMTSGAAITPTMAKRATAATNFFKGNLQHFFYCNQVLTATQILQLAKIAGLV